MLVLSRKPGQQIHIDSDIVITVLDISGKFVRLGVTAPENVLLLRGEIKKQIEIENEIAAVGTEHLKHLRKLASLIRGHKKA